MSEEDLNVFHDRATAIALFPLIHCPRPETLLTLFSFCFLCIREIIEDRKFYRPQYFLVCFSIIFQRSLLTEIYKTRKRHSFTNAFALLLSEMTDVKR